MKPITILVNTSTVAGLLRPLPVVILLGWDDDLYRRSICGLFTDIVYIIRSGRVMEDWRIYKI